MCLSVLTVKIMMLLLVLVLACIVSPEIRFVYMCFQSRNYSRQLNLNIYTATVANPCLTQMLPVMWVGDGVAEALLAMVAFDGAAGDGGGGGEGYLLFLYVVKK